MEGVNQFISYFSLLVAISKPGKMIEMFTPTQRTSVAFISDRNFWNSGVVILAGSTSTDFVRSTVKEEGGRGGKTGRRRDRGIEKGVTQSTCGHETMTRQGVHRVIQSILQVLVSRLQSGGVRGDH